MDILFLKCGLSGDRLATESYNFPLTPQNSPRPHTFSQQSPPTTLTPRNYYSLCAVGKHFKNNISTAILILSFLTATCKSKNNSKPLKLYNPETDSKILQLPQNSGNTLNSILSPEIGCTKLKL